MKLNIEELAKQAGIETKLWNMGAASLVYTEGCHGVARSEFEAVIRLIVERCAQECDDLAGHLLAFHDRQGANIAVSLRDSIRNLMED